jgi:hypothetical protein
MVDNMEKKCAASAKKDQSELDYSSQPQLASWMNMKRFSIEQGGIQRVTDEERQQNVTKFWNACTFWYFHSQAYKLLNNSRSKKQLITENHDRLSANMAVATLTTGALGGSMGLAFWDCFIIILVVNLTADLLPAWTASFGLTGLRMTTFS